MSQVERVVCTQHAYQDENGKDHVMDFGAKAENVTFEDGETFQGKLDAGKLRGQDGMACRTARFVVGTATAGWTAADCDYLCDGTDDQEEINAAIQALHSGGGEVVLLDGDYDITASIKINRQCVTLCGSGQSTNLHRNFTGTASEMGLVCLTANHCAIRHLSISGADTSVQGYKVGIYITGSNNTITDNAANNLYEGVRVADSAENNVVMGNKLTLCDRGICVYGSNNTITSNICDGLDTGGTGILLIGGNNIVMGNVCIAVANGTGISITGSYNVVTGNVCANHYVGITVNSGNVAAPNMYNTITGNVCRNCISGITMHYSARNTVTGNTCVGNRDHSILVGSTSSGNLIADNNIYGMDYESEGGASNSFVNNKHE